MSRDKDILTVLEERIARLDGCVGPGPAGEREIRHFVRVMASITPSQIAPLSNMPVSPIASPDEADECIARCELLRAIAERDDSLVSGPLTPDRQEWVADSSRLAGPDGGHGPREDLFVHPEVEFAPSTKPFGVGLYTSTPSLCGRSMWRAYLEEYGGGETLLRRPWHIWRVSTDARAVSVVEITSAREWTDFVCAYSTRTDGNVYPDWRAIANDADGVHITARAAAATQGFQFRCRHGLVAPAYWDVETTFWLKWVFKRTALLEVVS